MSFSAVKTATNVGRKIFSQTRHSVKSSAFGRSFLCVHKESQMSPSFTRSMWYLTASSSTGSGIHSCQSIDNLGSNVTRLRWPSVSQMCSCGNHARLHTEGDKELARFLEEEIKLEKAEKQSSEQIPGFSLSTDGASATLSKTKDGETIAVKFNINHSVEAEEQMIGGEGQEEEPAPPVMHAYPDFAVEISRDTQSVLSIKCHFTESELTEEDLHEGKAEEELDKDMFMIDEVSIHSGTSNDNTYCVGSEVMDGALYDMLLRMVNERGIDNDFVEKLSDIATGVEHGNYITFLEKLKDIVDC